ncbi:hypothetical protein ASPWEDRAFT_364186 [Aspergillus wentii DTO 134E9]|uniref:Uncharacterized protein n=1 Tax=Aspergillus wentii DTO 134E9 TaxID=1073089 RepID=A0A1L9RWF8_ASPWE|nr:uncharacterized protein ASPWEDRAFT_364186 [Aspergillus wentii DTO 134E9]OJJ39262.1 hypothetical protein ASPWEDRAFT_364186 [Aspergillus wentii DTO 134E9]
MAFFFSRHSMEMVHLCIGWCSCCRRNQPDRKDSDGQTLSLFTFSFFSYFFFFLFSFLFFFLSRNGPSMTGWSSGEEKNKRFPRGRKATAKPHIGSLLQRELKDAVLVMYIRSTHGFIFGPSLAPSCGNFPASGVKKSNPYAGCRLLGSG